MSLLFLAPLLLTVAIIIRADSRGPVLYRQVRTGLSGKPFRIYKFRTMSVQEDGRAVRQATRNDKRVTRIGRLLRKDRVQGGEIHWADEICLSNQANYGRSFAPKGQTPVIQRPARRFSQSVISSLTNRGKLRFMIDEGALKAPIFLNFLQRLVREAARKLFVIVDNLPVHRAHRVTAWVQDHADQIELFYLPSPPLRARAQSGRIPQQ